MTQLKRWGWWIGAGVFLWIGWQVWLKPVPPSKSEEHGTREGQDELEEEAKGPQGGRQLKAGDLTLEIAIKEAGVPPHFRIWAYDARGKLLRLAAPSAKVRLERLGGRREVIAFRAEGDYLRSVQDIGEPHSFKVQFSVVHEGRPLEVSYEQEEGRIELPLEAIKAAGIEVARAGQAVLRPALVLPGEIGFNEDQLSHVVPRFPGVIVEVRARLGDRVKPGDVLAVIQSNDTLATYEATATIEGTVVEKHASKGEYVRDDRSIFTVADLSTVWANLTVYAKDLAKVRSNQRVRIHPEGHPEQAVDTTLTYIQPLLHGETRSTVARAVLPNLQGVWKPGLFIEGDVIVEEIQVPVAVPVTALQSLRDWTVVFVTDGRVFEAHPVTVGRRDERMAEILEGLSPGERYATKNTFVLKAEVEKSGATHDH